MILIAWIETPEYSPPVPIVGMILVVAGKDTNVHITSMSIHVKNIPPTIMGRVLAAVGDTKKYNQRIVSVNMPHHMILSLTDEVTANTESAGKEGIMIEKIFGIPVRVGEKLSITTEI